ncbi:MAG: PrgI family protein [Oscillospiraceae bacterium]|jgi:hypothetical protein|nr:PrgI family protein [Oscillospiraceae bacterium]
MQKYKINKDIREFAERIGIFTLRQLIFVIIAVIASVIIWFVLGSASADTKFFFGTLAVVPIGAMCFVKYNGMPAEAIILAAIKFEFLTMHKLVYKSGNARREARTAAVARNLNADIEDERPKKESPVLGKLRKWLHSRGQIISQELIPAVKTTAHGFKDKLLGVWHKIFKRGKKND